MKNWFAKKRDPETDVRNAIRRKRWSQAVAFYEARVSENERDFAAWNILGELQMNRGAREQAIAAWRRALEGYALEGLYENMMGVAQKILRRAPDQTDVHLVLAEACLGLEYHADCLAAFRNYLKLAKHRAEPEMRSLFKRILDAPPHHAHLLAELKAIYEEARLEDIELERRLQALLQEAEQRHGHHIAHTPPSPEAAAAVPEPETFAAPSASLTEGLIVLDGLDLPPQTELPATQKLDADLGTSSWSNESSADDVFLPKVQAATASAGKDHFDLGMVYKEMRLWDAALSEFEQARLDPALRTRATLAMVDCLLEMQDLRRALSVLEEEIRAPAPDGATAHTDLIFQLGVVHELLGNLNEALEYFSLVFEQDESRHDAYARAAELRQRLQNDNASAT